MIFACGSRRRRATKTLSLATYSVQRETPAHRADRIFTSRFFQANSSFNNEDALPITFRNAIGRAGPDDGLLEGEAYTAGAITLSVLGQELQQLSRRIGFMGSLIRRSLFAFRDFFRCGVFRWELAVSWSNHRSAGSAKNLTKTRVILLFLENRPL